LDTFGKNADHADAAFGCSDQSLSLPLVASCCRSRFVVAMKNSIFRKDGRVIFGSSKAAAAAGREHASDSDELPCLRGLRSFLRCPEIIANTK